MLNGVRHRRHWPPALPTVKHRRAWLCPPMLSATAHGRQTRRPLACKVRLSCRPGRTSSVCFSISFNSLMPLVKLFSFMRPSFFHVSAVSFTASIKALFIRRAAFVFFISRTFPEKVDSFFLRRKQKRNPVSCLHRTPGFFLPHILSIFSIRFYCYVVFSSRCCVLIVFYCILSVFCLVRHSLNFLRCNFIL